MKRFQLKRIIPHITLVLSIMTLVFFIIDRYNEIMAFMTSEMSKWLFAGLAVCAVTTSICLIVENFREDDRRAAQEARRQRRLEREAKQHRS